MESIPPVARNDNRWHFLEWSPIMLGAFTATALSSVLLGFGVTIGLGISSTAPTWRDASAALAILSGLYLILQAILSFGLGGYLAGRLRAPEATVARATVADTVVEETERADGVHGLGAWALAVVMGAILATLLGAATVSRTSPARSVSQTSAAEPLLSYELDRLFRAARRAPNVDLSAERAEAGRILLTTSSHTGISSDDRTYLIQQVGALTGLSPVDLGASGRQRAWQRQNGNSKVTTQQHYPRFLNRHSRVARCRGGLGRSVRGWKAPGWCANARLDGPLECVRSARESATVTAKL